MTVAYYFVIINLYASFNSADFSCFKLQNTRHNSHYDSKMSISKFWSNNYSVFINVYVSFNTVILSFFKLQNTRHHYHFDTKMFISKFWSVICNLLCSKTITVLVLFLAYFVSQLRLKNPTEKKIFLFANRGI